jgi:hypothetical protein
LSMFESLRKNPKIEEAPLQGELMLFDPATSRFFVLNRTMAYVWRTCESVRGVNALIDGLQQEFSEVEADAARKDVERALQELIEAGLVTPATQMA